MDPGKDTRIGHFFCRFLNPLNWQNYQNRNKRYKWEILSFSLCLFHIFIEFDSFSILFKRCVLFQQVVFNSLRESHPENLSKFVAIPGDTTADDIGLSPSNKELLIKEVSVIFHMAANVKFDLPLKTAVTLNTRGTFNVLQLAKQVTNKCIFTNF